METLFPQLTPAGLVLACAIALAAGVVKGMVGFAMPMILISGLGTWLAPELALAGLILPTLATNARQALAHGWRAAWASLRRFRLFLGAGLVFLMLSAALVRVIPQSLFLILIGIPVAGFALMQLLGVRFRLAAPSPRIELAAGGLAGFIGGLSGVWAPPTVAYLTALETTKADQVRVQGVIYGVGAVALLGAHLGSGVLDARTAPFSALLVVPAMAGLWLGARVHERIDQNTFRQATLLVLLLAGLNLLRRGLWG